MGEPLVSVIVPTKQSEEFIEECLINIYEQTYPNIEIIIVDNYSTDDTCRIAEGYGVVYLKSKERAEQDNYGVLMSHGEYVYVTGSDLIRDEDFIEQAVLKCEQGYDALYMSVLTDPRVKHFWGRVKALERECYIGDNVIESARFFKKDVYLALGGFDEKLVQIEEDFQHRLDNAGYKTGRIQAREYHLHEEVNLKRLFEKSYYYGKFMRHYLVKHKSRGTKQLMPVRKAFIRNWKILIQNPILFSGFIIYKIVQYLGGICGILSSLLRGGRDL